MLEHFRHERRRMEEKRKQLAILSELHGSKLPPDIVESLIKGLEEIEVEPEENSNLETLKEKHDALTKQLQDLNTE